MKHSFHHALARSAGALAVAVGASTTVACSDRTTAPMTTPARGVVTSGEITSSLWTNRNGVLTYAGSVRANGDIVSDSGQSSTSVNGVPRSFTMSPHLLDSIETDITTSNLVRRANGGEMRRSGLPGARLRPQLPGSRSFTNVKDGKTFEVQVVGDPERGRPPRALLVSVNGRAVSLHQYTFDKLDGQWTPSHSRTTLFDSLGQVAAVAVNDFRATRTHRVGSAEDRAGQLGALASAVGSKVANLFTPQALFAAEEDEANCFREKMAVTVAEIGWSLALAGVIAAAGACATTIITCPGLIQAHIALGLADIALGIAFANLYVCQNPPPPPPPPPPANGGGGDGGGQNCRWVVWEISYNDGATWEFLDEQYVCG